MLVATVVAMPIRRRTPSIEALQLGFGRQHARPQAPLVLRRRAHEIRAVLGGHFGQGGTQGADGGDDVADGHVFHELVPEVRHRHQRGRLRQQDGTQDQQDQARTQRARHQEAGKKAHQGENR
ncbi:hypothetical protein D3C78_1573320 [compost metagenome]